LSIYNIHTDTLVESRLLPVASRADVAWAPDTGYLFVTRDLKTIDAAPAWSASAPIRAIPVRPPVTGDDLRRLTGFHGNVAEEFLPVSSTSQKGVR
jgi:hypothetical protein